MVRGEGAEGKAKSCEQTAGGYEQAEAGREANARGTSPIGSHGDTLNHSFGINIRNVDAWRWRGRSCKTGDGAKSLNQLIP